MIPKLSAAALLCSGTLFAQPPYPPSAVIEGIEWRRDSHFQHGPGSDQWPLTWADDGNLYGAWGDGWGWDKNGAKNSIGVTRISGLPPALEGKDVWGEGPGAGFGKPEALIAFDGRIYMFWTIGRSKDDRANTAAAFSSDAGETWTLHNTKAFPQVPDGFRVRGIAQFGRGYQGAIDDFVYVYFGFSRANDLYLARAPRQRILDAAHYEWFAGTQGGQARWASGFDGRWPVFTDPNGYIWHVGVTRIPGLGRFLLTKPHYGPGADRSNPEGDRSKVAGLGVFDAPAPWGPWTTVSYTDQFHDPLFKFTYFIPAKFVDAGSKTFWLVWSGYPEYDNINFVQGRFRMR